MPAKKTKLQTDHIYVTGKVGGPNVPHSKKHDRRDDSSLLALQLACPRRVHAGESEVFDMVSEIHNINAITIETKHFSSMVILGSDHPFNDVEAITKTLAQQMHGIIKISLEKIYFVEAFQLPDPNQVELNFLLSMSDYSFMQPSQEGNVFYAYFRLEKTNDEDRFAPRSADSLGATQVAEQDVYLYFEKSDRYIKILKKGESLGQKRFDRLHNHGVKDLYVSSDQGVEIQQRRVRQVLHSLLDEYSNSSSSAN